MVKPRRRKGREGRTPPSPPQGGKEENAVLFARPTRLRGSFNLTTYYAGKGGNGIAVSLPHNNRSKLKGNPRL